ncbi:phage terminase large subunit TerL [Acidisphaera rubrifaciens HS-AP3]|uniref:Phage terminase large subunit TerL n=2 Tax=Acidisphaera TaxID=50714 RepID=A0A0D6P662_9PROT|nr:phage terminase large subunit TerL [Acidisphaera rubrifaciens HS-AP3]
MNPDDGLADWAAHVLRLSGQTPARHHRLLIGELERIAAGESDRLMLLMPPGSAKSTYASILFPPWFLRRYPTSSVIAVSHTADLAAHFGRQVRWMIGEQTAWLGYQLAGKQGGAATRWKTTIGGEYFATGVRGPMIGRRADLVLIDDPVKSMHEADSLRARDHLWNWYRSELITRLRPKGRVILIMTRWHEDDLGGRLLAHEPEAWTCLRLPAIAGDGDPLGRASGEALWPEWEDEQALARKRASVGERVWQAQFQQEPQPPDGGLFGKARIDVLPYAPVTGDVPVVRGWDLASTPEEKNRNADCTVGLKMVRERSGRFVVLDVIRFRGSPHEVIEQIRAAAFRDGPSVSIGIPQDPGQAGRMQVTAIAGALAGYRVQTSRETGSKEVRALPVVAQAEAGNIAIVKGLWNQAFLAELQEFPGGRFDDQVDALARAFGMLLTAGAPAKRVFSPLLVR